MTKKEAIEIIDAFVEKHESSSATVTLAQQAWQTLIMELATANNSQNTPLCICGNIAVEHQCRRCYEQSLLG